MSYSKPMPELVGKKVEVDPVNGSDFDQVYSEDGVSSKDTFTIVSAVHQTRCSETRAIRGRNGRTSYMFTGRDVPCDHKHVTVENQDGVQISGALSRFRFNQS